MAAYNEKELYDRITKDIKPGWKLIFESQAEIKKSLEYAVSQLVEELNKTKEEFISPPIDKILEIFKVLEIEQIKCIILGQDPYPNPKNATGMSFSTTKTIPASLGNVFRAVIHNGYMKSKPKSGNLIQWVNQGVFLLNKYLTFNGTHSFWGNFTDEIIKIICYINNNNVFMLWGKEAQKVMPIISEYKHNKHLVLIYGHPSLIARKTVDFEKCPHFKEANTFLEQSIISPINWDLNSTTIYTIIKEKEIKDEKVIDIFTDGSAINNGKKNCVASWAYVILENRTIISQDSAKLDTTVTPTSPRAELLGVIQALKSIIENRIINNIIDINRINIYCDNEYVCKTFNIWGQKWIKENIIDDKKNSILVKQLMEYKTIIKSSSTINSSAPIISCIHMNSHKDQPDDPEEYYKWFHNKMVDEMATEIRIK